MPFSIIAVTLLLMASVAGAVVADHARVGSEIDSAGEGTEAIEGSIRDVGSYVDRELGIIILDISTDSGLGSLDDRAEVFSERAYRWIDDRFPMRSGEVTLDLIEREIGLKAESMEIVSFGEEVGGFTPAYLHGFGTLKVNAHSDHGSSLKEIEISTDGSYALPLASERGSVFERMVEDGGISISQMMGYELESLAQYRVLDGYGARTQYGSRGTEAIITSADVRNAYDNALKLAGALCFNDSGAFGVIDSVDLADVAAGDEITIDRSAFYGQVFSSILDDLILKWSDYLCGGYILDRLDSKFSSQRALADAIVAFFTGDDPFSAAPYIEAAMEKASVDIDTYRTPGHGTTTVTVDGFTVTVENPTADVLEQGWLRDYVLHYKADEDFLQDTLRRMLNTAAYRLYESDYQPLVVKLDPSDDRTFVQQVTAAYKQLSDECSDIAGETLEDVMSGERLYDPLSASIADTVMMHAESLVLEEELVQRIMDKLADLTDNADSLIYSEQIQKAVHSYRSKVYSDLGSYECMRTVEGSGPGIIEQILTSVLTYRLKLSFIGDSVSERTDRILDEVLGNLGTNPYSKTTALPKEDHFTLVDGSGNRMKEYLELEYISDPVVSEPVVLSSKCTHVTGFMEDVCAGYSTTFEVRLWDSIDYTIHGRSSLSDAMGGSLTSSASGTITNSIVLQISVASGWALHGIDYKPTDTVLSDAWSKLSVYLEPLMEPLRKIISIVKDVIDTLNRCLMEIARYISDVVMYLYESIIGPLTEMAEWIENKISEMVGDELLELYYSLDLSEQTVGFDYLGYRFEIEMNLASLMSPVKTLFTATLSGPVAGMDLVASITVKAKGELNANNVFITGKATVSSANWKVKVSMDPLMKSSKHLITLSADIGDADLSLVLPELEDYNEIGVTLSRIPGIGKALSSIPVPGLGVNIGLDAGISLKYAAPVAKGLVINEFESNPRGNDGGHEWVELWNNSVEEIDLTGYKLTASSDRSKKTMVLSGSISPGEFLLIEPDFLLVNNSGKLTKNGEGLTLKDPDGLVVDKTGTFKDDSDDDRTWQRTYDGSGEWEFKKSTMGRTNGSYTSVKLMAVETAKEIVVSSVQKAFDEVGPITDTGSLQEIIKHTVKNAVDSTIEKVAGCLVEASVFVKVDVLDPTSTASAGIRIALRCDSELVEDVLKYIAGKIESMLLSMKNPYRIDGVAAFTDNIDLEVTFDAKVQYPGILARHLDDAPKVDFGLTFRTNISALVKVFGKDVGTPGIECGLRVIDCPLELIPSKLSPKKGMDHDLWLFKVNVEWG